MVRGALETREIVGANVKDRPRVEVLERLQDRTPPAAVSESLPTFNRADFRILCRRRTSEDRRDCLMAGVGKDLRVREKAVPAVMDENITRDIVVKRNALETVDRLSFRLQRYSEDLGPSKCRRGPILLRYET